MARSSSEKSKADQGEDGSGDGGQTPPQPVGFWDPQLQPVRRAAVKKWLLTTAVLMALILGVLSVYWAVFKHLPRNLSSLVVYVVDMDGVAPYDNTGHDPLVGNTITALAHETVAQGNTLGFGVMPASAFNNDPLEVRRAVYNWDAWAAIIVNPNATALLYQAVETGNASYDPLGACQFVFQDARDDTTYYDFILPVTTAFMREAVARVGMQWAGLALANASTPQALANLRAAPQALSPGIGSTEYNLRPFWPYEAIPAVSIGLIYLIIVSFFSFSFYLPIHMTYLAGRAPLRFRQLILWRWGATMVAYFFLSLAYSLISLAFGINFGARNPVTSHTEPTDIAFGNPNAYGHASFVVYWMLNFLGMAALGLACENAAMAVGQPWMGVFLIFWVISNVATGFYDIDIEPAFFRWGYAWPLHNVVEGSRQILFDLHSRLGLNFGILIAWTVVNTALFPFMCYWMRFKKQRGIKEYWG
ncbi:uncharacterized protein K452DRAFT_246747 [Aplosporella prunicola CBS 121167]|uniref:DUF3533 domain-containing protein n=1 Tax=Aplosporella prunicola CBS 121167 TaxID=1176127 RepID=A0A6A6BHE4_9PEZI|nr:uncharacterized protein K452DRAFT_246747 [Aplosporella prunicola CBS 121167]KAF2143562.1 hypothetical protein K452DRAFT_246747 [Aplosporella prunicola CBS 121167]